MDFNSIKDPLVRDYLSKKYGANKVQDAQAEADTTSMLGVAAGAMDSLANGMNQPVALQNRMQDLGKAPTMVEGRQQKTDVSGLVKQAQLKLDQARSDEDNAVKMAFEQRKAELAREAAAKADAQKQANWQADYNYKVGSDKDKLALEEEKLRLLKNKGNSSGSGGVSNDPLAPIPKELRDNYLSSESKVKEFDQALLDVDPLITEAEKFSLRDHLTPNALGGNDFASVRAKIAAAIMNRVPGIRSDADFNNLVVPMIPKPGDPPNVAKDKAAGLRRLLKSSRPVNEVGNVYMPKPQTPATKRNGGASGSWDAPDYDSMSDTELEALLKQGE